MNRIIILLFAVFLSNTGYAATPAADGAEVYFIEPENGTILTSPITIKFGLINMGVAPAGINFGKYWSPPLTCRYQPAALDTVIPTDDNHRHFGMGNTETILKLAPGEHTLQLLLGDFVHIPHDPPIISDKITITVK